MELVYILIVTILASGASLISLGRWWAPVMTCLTTLTVLVLSIFVAMKTIATGEVVAIGNWLSCDSFGSLILLIIAFVGFLAAIFSWGYINEGRHAKNIRKIRHYYAQFNLFLLSMLAVPILSQVALVWIAVELTTLLSVFLVSFESTSEALEAAWKYVVLTCIGAAIALLGILILYWGMNVVSPGPFTWNGLIRSAPAISPVLLTTSFFFILIGFGTKVGLVPLHTWLPDAHSQAPSPICALLSGIETTTVLYVIMRLLPLFRNVAAAHAGTWFVVFGLISVGVAAFLLIQAKDYKRLFAFSTIEHMGIILVAVGLGGYAAHFGATLQIVSHAVTKSLCFFAAGATLMTTGSREISSIRGLIRLSPLSGTFLLIGGLAIAGAPPFSVFLSEFSILRAGLTGGQYLVTGLLALFIIVAFFGIMFQVNHMVFGKPDPVSRNFSLPASCVVALIIAALPVILLGFFIPESIYKLLHLVATSFVR